MSDAKGWTTSEVPMTSSRSAAGRSSSAASQKRSGSASPKNTMSGLTRPPHAVHLHAGPTAASAGCQRAGATMQHHPAASPRQRVTHASAY